MIFLFFNTVNINIPKGLWSYIEIGLIAFLIIIFCAVLLSKRIYRKKAENDLFTKLTEQLQTDSQRIQKFFNSLSSLSEHYISKSDEVNFIRKWEPLFDEIKKNNYPVNLPNYEQIDSFLKVFSNLHSEITKLNDVFIANEISKNRKFLSNIDGKILDLSQCKVVVSDEDRTLVLAGAGSGKTLTIAAKVKYLYEIKNINPDEILLISFTNKSALEMTERINNKLGIPIEATTFHKLGLNIIKDNLGYCPEVKSDLTDFVHNLFESKLLNDLNLVQTLTKYFAYYLEIPENLEDYNNLGELYEAEKTADLETLKSKYNREQYINTINLKNRTTLGGEHVKSIEETKIANFLFINGINYEYEKPYPFKSDDPNRKTYRPDFYLIDYDIYLEHFGISKNYRCPWLSEVEEKKYLDGIIWKREFHKKNGTKLIETYSYYTKEGKLLSELEKLLKANNVIFKPRNFTDIFKTVYAKKSSKYFSEFIKLCSTFITLFKSNGLEQKHFDYLKSQSSEQKNKFLHQRNCIFLDIVQVIFNEYQKYLINSKSVDFSDMINDAAKKIITDASILPKYKYVIIDEYQDISQSRFNMLKAIIKKTNAKLLCIGDDWQSIYRFAGSDVNLFTGFEQYFGFTNLLKIEKTYRNSQQLIDEASKFITRNPFQIKKSLVSAKHLKYPLIFWGYNTKPYQSLKQIIDKIISEFGPEKSILLLGRTNYDIEILKNSELFSISTGNWDNKTEKLIYLPSPKTPIMFLSVHKAKGLEADNVILLNFKDDTLGFPNKIADDNILNLIISNEEKYIFAEERRLFYVAITRTKNRTYVLTDNQNPSVFFKEFTESESCCFVNIKHSKDESKPHCPRCKTGILSEAKYQGKSFIRCSNYPMCKYKINDISILSNPKKCPSCGGFLTKRNDKKGHWFIGCTNYPYCNHTENISSKKK